MKEWVWGKVWLVCWNPSFLSSLSPTHPMHCSTPTKCHSCLWCESHTQKHYSHVFIIYSVSWWIRPSLGPACPGTCNSTPYGGSGNETTSSSHITWHNNDDRVFEQRRVNLEPYLKSLDCWRVKKLLSIARSLKFVLKAWWNLHSFAAQFVVDKLAAAIKVGYVEVTDIFRARGVLLPRFRVLLHCSIKTKLK